ncbi:MAG: ATP-binding protein [Candidatus Latescibacterota bacterium]
MRQRAAAQYERILEAVENGAEYPQLDRVYFALGSLYDDEPQTAPQAILAYRRGLVLNPLSAVGHNSLGLLLMVGGQILGALGEFKVAIQLDPAFAAPYTSLARLLYYHVGHDALQQEYAHVVEEFGARAPQVLARLSLELAELAKQQAYEGVYTKGHQLKNLLGIAGSRLRGLARRCPVQGACAEELDGLLQEHERLYQEWVGFLGAMKPEVVRPAVVEPARLVQRVVDLLRSQAGRVPVHVRVQAGVPRIEADERMLREAVTNLCLNAVEALGDREGGRLTVGVGYDPGRSAVYIEVEDNGPGIPEEHLEHVFDAGFTTKKQGNGYGLSIARRIAQAHHGELRVKSRVGRGTVFRLDLPANIEAGSSEEGLALRYAGQRE